jgi:hypothetical protein
MRLCRERLLARAEQAVARNQSCAAFVDSVTGGKIVHIDIELRIAAVWHTAQHKRVDAIAEAELQKIGRVAHAE